VRPILGFGGALFVIGISDTLVYSLDRTIIAGFVGAAAIVVYEVALRLQSAVRTISSLAGSALISTASRLIAQRRHERLHELVLIGSFLGVMITTPVAVLLMVLAAPTIDLWVGHEYVRYATYAQIFISIWLVSSNTGVLGSAITGTGRLGLFAVLAIVGSVASLGLSIGLTAAWGTVGVIWGTFIPSVAGLPIWMYFVLRRLELPIRQYMSYVVVPAYAFIAAWSGLVLLADALLSPSGFLRLALFTLLSLAVFWAVAFPMTRIRWRRAVRGELLPAGSV
jgi:O-antigen/teichoic acid export membrane protein